VRLHLSLDNARHQVARMLLTFLVGIHIDCKQ